MNIRHYCRISGALFGLVALAHLARIVYGLSLQVDGVAIPMWVSWIAVIVPGTLAITAFRVARAPGG